MLIEAGEEMMPDILMASQGRKAEERFQNVDGTLIVRKLGTIRP
jgi:hypothetical protein